ncbi:hypothetical protein Tco_1258761 [Tanacetum coccineum]
MDIVAERAARKAAKSEVQSSLKPSPVAGDAKPSPPPRNPILRAAKHAPPLANPKPKAPKLKASDVTESDQGDGSVKRRETIVVVKKRVMRRRMKKRMN